MNIRVALFAAVASTCLFDAQAFAATHKSLHAAGVSNRELLDEVRALQAEVQSLKAQVSGQATEQADTRQQIQATQDQVHTIQTDQAATQTQLAAVPATVQGEVAKATEKAHHADKFYYRGLTITPGGFLELAGMYRQHFQGNDMASSFAIPFPNNRASHESEGRFSARQSRLSFLAEGAVNPSVKLAMYGEFDFLGGAQTANSNESNSFNPRIRNLYGSIDWTRGDHGWHLLAGQNWSLVTMNTKGITPRNELTPPQIDAQYVPGFVWARQPQVRLTGDFLDHRLWVAVSAENPQTTFGGTVPSTVTNVVSAGSGFDAANSLSINHVPDFVGKVAYEGEIAGHSLHIEGFGLVRNFDAHLNGGGSTTGHGYGYGGGIVFQVVPHLLDAQFSGMTGKGIGRYGSAQLPDVTFAADGRIHPINEYMLLAGLTLHATKALDIYGFAGEEQQERKLLGGAYGIGLPTADNSGCFIEGGACGGNSRRVRQLTAGVWDKFYQGPFGRAQIGLQYSYTQRQLFVGVGGAPHASQNMAFVSFRYYPF
ncbi:hypothetical protein [Flavisphingomonas formosensis]|uniref:hypothetical protein n=1 Tax=Flavisphingomonas formosensis TaxID=861534 RepID=UPI0012F8AFC0|nr:hypothetical protein [Sphingomonas formosensis]